MNEPTTSPAAPPPGAAATLATPDDQRLLAACLAGVPAGWDEFVRRFGGLFVHVTEPAAFRPLLLTIAGTPQRSQPFYKRWWFWTAVGAVVVGGATATAIVLSTESAPVGNLTFRGLTFRRAGYTFMDTASVPSGGDWRIYRGGAVVIEGADNCAIRDCVFDGVGGNGIFVKDYIRGVEITGCDHLI